MLTATALAEIQAVHGRMWQGWNRLGDYKYRRNKRLDCLHVKGKNGRHALMFGAPAEIGQAERTAWRGTFWEAWADFEAGRMAGRNTRTPWGGVMEG